VYDFRQRNVVYLDIQGVDMHGEWEFETPVGTITPGLTWTHFTKFDQHFPGTETFIVLGTSGYNQTFASIQDQGRANLSYNNGPFAADIYANYTGKYKNWNANSVIPLTLSAAGLPAGGGDPVKANVTWDFNASYTFSEGGKLGDAQVFVDVTNVFDKMPPFVNGASGYNNYAGNPIGRVTTIGLRSRW
jgi:iron complex outermembrane receptor protein